MTNLQYSGEWTNTSTGLQYLRARWYDPSAGVFNRLDPYAGDAGDPLSLNKYQYTHADPVSGIDPTGLSVTQGTGNYGGLINGSSLDAGGPTNPVELALQIAGNDGSANTDVTLVDLYRYDAGFGPCVDPVCGLADALASGPIGTNLSHVVNNQLQPKTYKIDIPTDEEIIALNATFHDASGVFWPALWDYSVLGYDRRGNDKLRNPKEIPRDIKNSLIATGQ